MKFELKNEYVKKGSLTSPSTIVLPSGVYKIIINVMGKPVKENYKCNFTKIKTNCVFINVGFGINVCGDILITMKELGYDLASKDDWKRAKKEEKEKIVAKYDELVSEKPELFDASKVDLNKLEEEVKKREEEKAAPEAEAEEGRKCKFEIEEGHIEKGETGEPSLVILPSGICEVLILTTTSGKAVMNYKCKFTKINTNCVNIDVGFVGTLVCGDILITMKEMGYDLASKDDLERAKKEEKEKIVAKYDELVLEKPELFDASKVKTFDERLIEEMLLGEEAEKAEEEKRRKDIIKKYGKKNAEKVLNKEIFLDMTKAMLVDARGEPDDKKENVSKDLVKLKCYYGKTETSRGTTKYKYEVNLENDLVVGWKDL